MVKSPGNGGKKKGEVSANCLLTELGMRLGIGRGGEEGEWRSEAH